MASGLTPSLVSEATPLWDEFCFRFYSDRSGADPALQRVIDADPGCAVPRALAALAAQLGSPSFDRDAELRAALDGRAPRDWERSLVAAIRRFCEEGPWASYDDWVAHHEAFPEDLHGLSLAAFLVLNSATRDREDRAEAMLERTRQAVGDDPFVLAGLAMTAQERGDLVRAHDLATRVLAADPGHIHGAHPMAHVYFESGEHAAGLSWLDGWLATEADRGSAWFPHLTWHSALHTLGLGDGEETLARYRTCSALEGATSIPDRASLLWRCQLHGLVPFGTDPADPPTLALVEQVRKQPVFVFRTVHAVLALAGAGDADGLRALAATAASSGGPGVAELVPIVAEAFAHYVEGRYGAAVDDLLRVEPEVVRLGGSHAQREVFEDTLIEALLRAGRLEEAARRLTRRLDRRESLLDRRWLARTVPSSTAG